MIQKKKRVPKKEKVENGYVDEKIEETEPDKAREADDSPVVDTGDSSNTYIIVAVCAGVVVIALCIVGEMRRRTK